MNRIKKWLQYNRAAVIWIGIILIYTMLMGGIILLFGQDLNGCSSGSMSQQNNKNSTIETSVGGDYHGNEEQ